MPAMVAVYGKLLLFLILREKIVMASSTSEKGSNPTEYRSVIIKPSGEIKSMTGLSFDVTCSHKNGYQQAFMRWKDPNNRILEDYGEKPTFGARSRNSICKNGNRCLYLHLINAQRGDSGNYTCYHNKTEEFETLKISILDKHTILGNSGPEPVHQVSKLPFVTRATPGHLTKDLETISHRPGPYVLLLIKVGIPPIVLAIFFIFGICCWKKLESKKRPPCACV